MTENHENGSIDFHDACEILSALPVSEAPSPPILRRAVESSTRSASRSPPILRRAVESSTRSASQSHSTVTAGQIHVKALISSAFTRPAASSNWSLTGI